MLFFADKRQGAGSPQHDFMLTIFPYEINLHDLALCNDNNDNHCLTLLVLLSGIEFIFVSLVASFVPSLLSGPNDATRATNKLNALQKSRVLFAQEGKRLKILIVFK